METSVSVIVFTGDFISRAPYLAAWTVAIILAVIMVRHGGGKAEKLFLAGSGIFKSTNPEARGKAIVKATTHYKDPQIIAEVSKNLGEAMPGLDIKQIPAEELLATRGW